MSVDLDVGADASVGMDCHVDAFRGLGGWFGRLIFARLIPQKFFG
jgi:hypothetical protein